MAVLIAILVIAVILIMWGITSYNSFVKLGNKGDEDDKEALPLEEFQN